jgi:hypothetical protein
MDFEMDNVLKSDSKGNCDIIDKCRVPPALAVDAGVVTSMPLGPLRFTGSEWAYTYLWTTPGRLTDVAPSRVKPVRDMTEDAL